MKRPGINDIVDSVALYLRQNIDRTPTEDDVANAIGSIVKMYASIGQTISTDDQERVMKTLTDRIVVSMDTGTMIIDKSTYKPWLAHRKAEIDEYYWERYKKFLLGDKRWEDNIVSALDRVGDSILDLLGNPADQNIWKRKGLILGDIQSGKTSNYLALINKAADAGYKLIILLSGSLEALRKQTQERVDEGFVGLNSRNALNKDIDKKYVGVGQYDKRRTAFPLTDIISDFDVRKLQALNFSAKSLPEPIVFVVKKNTTMLKHLLAWINSSYKDTDSESIHAPLLFIDDEADNASINTKKPELEPTAINRGIRNILRLFARSTYVAVTATPFANIFIDPDDQAEFPDLFPSDFIYALSAPPYYIGTSAIFGEDAMLPNCIVPILDADDVFSSSYRSGHTVASLPVSLMRAINYFLLCNVVRDFRGVRNDHRSMLVNISPYTLPQESTYDLIDIYVDRIQKDIKAYSKLKPAQAMKNASISMLSDVWIETELQEITGKDFIEIMPMLTESSLPIRVTMVNTKTKTRGLERLDYEPYKDNGYRVIVVGGNSLSRGITLEGLCVSYFYRESKMYDTLLQMGRWFGYRPGYQDIIKVWMSERTIEWFAFINKACDELRSEISYMNKLEQTPSEFGLKVLEHPDTLMITAGSKMRTAKPFERWISLSGKLVETAWLTTKTIDYNLKHTNDFVENIVKNCKKEESISDRLFSGISSEAISVFVGNFASHPGRLIFNAREIGTYIDKNKDYLGSWYVYIANGREVKETIMSGIKLNRTLRKMLVNDDCIMVSGNNSRVGSRGSVKISLSLKEQSDATEAYIEELKAQGKYTEGKPITVPDYIYLRFTKAPILIIYYMTCTLGQLDEKASKELADKTIVGLSLGFPRISGEIEKRVRYKINLIEQRSFNPFSPDVDFEGDEDDEN